MAIAEIVRRGYGATIAKIVTRGYSIGQTAPARIARSRGSVTAFASRGSLPHVTSEGSIQ